MIPEATNSSHDEVDGGPRDQREHFLGDGLGHGEETGPVPGSDDDAFHDGKYSENAALGHCERTGFVDTAFSLSVQWGE